MALIKASGILVTSLVVLAGCSFVLLGCVLQKPVPLAEKLAIPPGRTLPQMASASQEMAWPDRAGSPAVVRVAGDKEMVAEFVDGEYRVEDCRITTPLPEGYPAPTPPGAIELKNYPPVRRAGISGAMPHDWGMNIAFFPLFNHIKRREIAMTSPVEMNYEGLAAADADAPSSWTMSFLYRTPDLGPAGTDPSDKRILIEDIPSLTVLSIGVRGPYKFKNIKRQLEQLREWLAGQSEWEAAGEPRTLFYNGPDMPAPRKWSEVQIPLRRRAVPSGNADVGSINAQADRETADLEQKEIDNGKKA